jgi:hypothetical protein
LEGTVLEQRDKRRTAAISGCILLGLVVGYVTLYCGTTDYDLFQLQGDLIKIRLFQHEWQQTCFKPLLAVERLLRDGDFSGQVANGASVPPPIGRNHIHLILPVGLHGRIQGRWNPRASKATSGVFQIPSVRGDGSFGLTQIPAMDDLTVTWEYANHGSKPRGLVLGGPYYYPEGVWFYLGTQTECADFAAALQRK